MATQIVRTAARMLGRTTDVLFARRIMGSFKLPSRSMASGIMQPSQNSGRGSSGQGKSGSYSWWPLGLAGASALLTAQAAAGIDADKAYVSIAKAIDSGEETYMGGINSIIHWLHLFGPGPAGQELRRRLAQAGCVHALIRKESYWNDKVLETYRQANVSTTLSMSEAQKRELQGKVLRAYWMRESCYLALSELLRGCPMVYDIVLDGSHQDLQNRILEPPSNGINEFVVSLVNSAGWKRIKQDLPDSGPRPPFMSSGVDDRVRDPFALQGKGQYDFGSIARGVDGGKWGDVSPWDDTASDATAAVSHGEGLKDVGSGSRQWSASQVKLMQMLAKDERLANAVLSRKESVSSFADNLAPSKEQSTGFLKLLELDRQRGVLKTLLDIVRHGTGKTQLIAEDSKLQQRLADLAGSSDPICRGFARMTLKELSDAGASLASQELQWASGDQVWLSIATEDELKPAPRHIHWGRLAMHLPVAMACGAIWGTGREYVKLRGRTVIPVPNILQTASRAGLGAAIGSAVAYASSVFMMRIVNEYVTTKLETPKEVVWAAGGAITSQFCFIMSNWALGEIGQRAPGLFGAVLVPSKVRERASDAATHPKT